MGDVVRRLGWPLALAAGSLLAWALIRIIDDPALRRAMVGPRSDDPRDPEERAILRERLEKARTQRTIPFEEAFPRGEARR